MKVKCTGYTLLDRNGFDVANSILGQIAHDLSNLVTPLVAYPELIRGTLDEGSFARGLMDQIDTAAQSIAHIAQQLQLLAKRDADDVSPMDLNGMVRDVALGLETGALPMHLSLELDLGEVCMPMRGNVMQLSAAVQSFCLNAIEAMEEGPGVLRIATDVSDEPPKKTAIGAAAPAGRYYRVCVTDSGNGVPETIRPFVCDPFVTSKSSAAKRGAGLGLTIAYKAARDHGGYIDFDTSAEGGTTFCLFLPVPPPAAAQS